MRDVKTPKTIIFSLSVLFISLSATAQVSVKQHRNIDSLVKAFLLGKGILCQNIKYSGSRTSIGTFNFNFETENFKNGLLLCTGEIEDVKGPNNNTAITGNSKLQGDKALTRLARKKTFDASILEFDFISSANKISFNYFFGSEEYMEYVGSHYNDVFGFFISGPGMKEKNLAVLPGTNKRNFVTINNVNHKKNKEYFIDNNWFASGSGKGKKLKKLLLDKENLANLQYDGFTRVLKAECNVVPGKRYHIRIAIADAGDGVLDSGVFLEKNSFSSERDASAKDNRELTLDSLWLSKSGKGDGVPVEIVKSYHEPEKELQLLSENVEFDLDKTFIPDSSRLRIQKLLAKATAPGKIQIELYGHADTSGNSVYNKQLSLKRSKAVGDYLISIGFPPENIVYKAYGSAVPKAANASETGRARNRRVEIVFREKM
jgi:outer membrane protein OmpA-like peptidoglycan-associated protein